MLAMIGFLLQINASIAQGPATPELMDDPVIRGFCEMLMRKATTERFGEQGAFVVRTAAGTLYFVMWPPSDDKNHLRWYGRFPKGTVAVVHTHSPWLPTASKLDMRAARRARIPVYVLTPACITKTTGEPSVVVMEGDWGNLATSGNGAGD
jgi:proteasome lid subunit RPN8/RPN11